MSGKGRKTRGRDAHRRGWRCSFQGSDRERQSQRQQQLLAEGPWRERVRDAQRQKRKSERCRLCVFRIDEAEGWFQTAMSNARLCVHRLQVKDGHTCSSRGQKWNELWCLPSKRRDTLTCGLASGSCGRGNCNQRLQLSRHGLALPDRGIDVVQEISRETRIDQLMDIPLY